MHLIVFPGGGNPTTPRYSKVYALIEREARARGFERVHTVVYPAHITDGQSEHPALTVAGAIDAALPIVKECERSGIRYTFLGRSFGTIVAAKLAIEAAPKHQQADPLGPRRLLDAVENARVRSRAHCRRGRDKGVRITEASFPSASPLEWLLGSLPYPAVLATGTNDKQAPPAHVRYLQSLYPSRTNDTVRIVEGAPHEVSEDNSSPDVIRSYLDALFA